MKKITLSTATALLLSTTTQADIIGFDAGAYLWQPQPSGNFSYNGDPVDLEDDLGFEDDTANGLWASVEHPIPLLPNVKAEYLDLSSEGKGTLNRNIDFGGQTFNLSQDVSSQLSLKQTDLILYYEILDNWVNIDLGIDIKYLDAKYSLESATNKEEAAINTPLPLLYADAQFDLPFSGFNAAATVKTVSYDDNEFSDYKATLGYETSIGFGIDLGYRSQVLKLDDDDKKTDITFDGVYGALYYDF